MAALTLLFAGDVMLNGIMPSARTFSEIRAEVTRADLAFANLEIPLTATRTPTTRKTPEELQRKAQFILKADPGHGKWLADAGFDLVSLGNNHAMDFGADGLAEMRRTLREVGMGRAGAGKDREDAEKCTVRVLPDGTRVGLISAMAFVSDKALWKTTPATDEGPGVAAFAFQGTLGDEAKEELQRRVDTAKEKCDVLVVGVHWGTERKTVPDRYQINLGRALVDAGADIVWGTHPHVLQGAELYRGKPILYSMGNLISPLPAKTGFIESIREDGEVSYRFVPATIAGGRVTLTTGKAALKAKNDFRKLCSALVAKYPDPNSQPLFAPLTSFYRIYRAEKPPTCAALRAHRRAKAAT